MPTKLSQLIYIFKTAIYKHIYSMIELGETSLLMVGLYGRK